MSFACYNAMTGAFMLGETLGRFKILQPLGSGGMGEVYLAEDIRLGRKVALKLLRRDSGLSDDLIHRFEQEARAASALNHPNIVTIYDIGETENTRYIAAEYVEGQTLRQRMAAGKIPIQEVLVIAIQIVSALHAAHSAGIIHRDIKPENIMLRANNTVKVLDFGLAKLLFPVSTSDPHLLVKTAVGMGILGTPRYMSPEQLQEGNLDGRTDLFSLGIILYEIIACRHPFDSSNLIDLVSMILKQQPSTFSEIHVVVPEKVEAIVFRALEKEPGKRYPSAKSMLVDLEDAQAQLGTVSRGSFSQQVLPQVPRRKYLMPRLSLLFGVAILLGIFYVQTWNSPPAHSQKRIELAVLPFRNLNPGPETDFLGFSLADAIITKLSYLSDLTVRPSSSIEKYQGTATDIRKAAREMKVSVVLIGRYLKEGNRLRITTQLVDIRTNHVLLGDVFEVNDRELLSLQNRMSDFVVTGLHLNLSGAETALLRHDIPRDPLAYEYHLRGVYLLAAGTKDVQIARDLLEKSLALDSKYPLTWAHLGNAYRNLTQELGGGEYYSKAEQAYRKAIELDPEQLLGPLSMADYLTETNRVEEAVPLLRMLNQRHPDQASVLWKLSYAYRYAGMLQESLEAGLQALQIDPQMQGEVTLLNTYLYLGRYEEFRNTISNNDLSYNQFYLGLSSLYLSEEEKAKRHFNRSVELDPANFFSRIGKALVYAIERKNEEGLIYLKELEEKSEQTGYLDGEAFYKLAQAYAFLGDSSAAVLTLERSIQKGFFCHPYIISDPFLKECRSHSQWKNVVKQAYLRHREFRNRFFLSGSASMP